MPADTPSLVRLFAEELAKPGIYSFYLEDGHPIKVQRYVDPDDLMMNRGVDSSPPEIVRTLENLWDYQHKRSGAETLLHAMLHVAQYRLTCSAIIIGSAARFHQWLGLDAQQAFALKVLDRSCDFYLFGMKGYFDDTLPEDCVVLLGGDTPTPTIASVRMGLAIQMEENLDGLSIGQGPNRNRAVIPRRRGSDEGQESAHGSANGAGTPEPGGTVS
ncbi:MAG: hypothetical protein KDB07_02985 [Planctomycetes bacterium]|nr:hypothetical protein [Planctomycetota bacterium]